MMSNKEYNIESSMLNATSSSGKRQIDIQLLYLDLDVCEPCRGADNSLDMALDEIEELLKESGYTIKVKKTHIDSINKAVSERLESSPTIRVNGKDIQLDIKEDHCPTCGSLTDSETVYCRQWVYKGETYIAPPKQMIIDAVMESINSEQQTEASNTSYKLPDNIKNFFESKKLQSCCSSHDCC
jgi:galactitol-specific phosphotransferase system IIB component